MIASSRLEDLLAISSAPTADHLWRYLLSHPTARATTNAFEAMIAFRTLHKSGEGDAVRTAGLLCTDGRWRRVTASLIADIEDAGILGEADLDQLGDGFLCADRYPWPVPARWLHDGTVSRPGRARSARAGEVVIERAIAAPLRRWAAARIARRRADRGAEVLARAQELDARAGDATLCGLLDACDGFPAEVRDALVALGCAWPNGDVRLRALQLYAAVDRTAAMERARHDPSAKVRAWGQQLTARHRRPGAHRHASPSSGRVDGPSQLPLFGGAPAHSE